MKWKERLWKWLTPPMWVMLLLTVLCACLLCAVFLCRMEKTLAACLVYVLSFYTFVSVCIFFAKVLPSCWNKMKQAVYSHQISGKYMTDETFRTGISLHLSLTANLLYAAMHGISFLLYGSMWFVIFAVYYAIVGMLRFLLVRYVHREGFGKKLLSEHKRTIVCAIILLAVNFVLTGAVMMILFQDRGFSYPGILIYVMALYTFYMTTHAIVGLVKHRKNESPIMIFTKVVALTSALVSMLTLETAMFSQFGGQMSRQDQRLMIALTGAGISIAIITMAVWIIVRCKKMIKRIKENRDGTKA